LLACTCSEFGPSSDSEALERYCVLFGINRATNQKQISQLLHDTGIDEPRFVNIKTPPQGPCKISHVSEFVSKLIQSYAELLLYDLDCWKGLDGLWMIQMTHRSY